MCLRDSSVLLHVVTDCTFSLHSIVCEYSHLFILLDAGDILGFIHPEHPVAEMRVKPRFHPFYGYN